MFKFERVKYYEDSFGIILDSICISAMSIFTGGIKIKIDYGKIGKGFEKMVKKKITNGIKGLLTEEEKGKSYKANVVGSLLND